MDLSKSSLIAMAIILFSLIALTGVSSLSGNSIFSLEKNPSNSPSNNLNKSQIIVKDNHVLINISDAMISSYKDTKSMEPLLNSYSNGIVVEPSSESELEEGDIVTYEKEGELIVHRIIHVGEDSEGIYFIVKGDNNPKKDGKIRFNDVKYKLIGVIY